MTTRQISYGLVLMFVSLCVAIGVAMSDEGQTVVPANAEKAALAQFNPWIGEWRGAGQVKRGSTRGAWREDGEFVWKFDKKSVTIEYKVKDSKHIKSGVLSWDAKAKQYALAAEFENGTKYEYAGKFEDGALELESKPDQNDFVSRLTFRQLNENRMLLLYEQRKSTQTIYQRIGEVGYTREGTRLAASDSTGPECVVTGGAGTMKVTHKGQTYYVCCTGCRDAFNADPEGIIAEYKAKLSEKNKQK